ncbi:MAG: hypothetical protein ABF651_11180 [Sporolactobacillus sp.]
MSMLIKKYEKGARTGGSPDLQFLFYLTKKPWKELIYAFLESVTDHIFLLLDIMEEYS